MTAGPSTVPEGAVALIDEVVHDLNNALLVIRGYASVLRSTLDAPQQRRDLDEISNAVDHATNLTQRLLDVARPAVQAAGESAELQGGASGGSETILLVEDEEQVRVLVCRVLESIGYRVLHASKPSEAQLLLESDETIDLLVTDVVMPEMNGFELAAAASVLRPATRALFMSGNAYVASGSIRPGTPLLKKPFRAAELARAVRGALDGVGMSA